MKLALDITNGIVTDAKEIKESTIKNTTQSYPYTKYDDKANPYAKMLRLRDARNDDGWDCEVIVVKNGDPEDYILKKYDRSSKTFSNDGGETEEQRLYRINIRTSFHPVAKDRYDSNMVPNSTELSELASVYGDDFEYIKDKIVNRKDLEYGDKVKIESRLRNLNYTTMEKLVFQVANLYTVLSYKKRDGKDIAGEYVKELSYWWSKFIGTPLEIRALSEIAACYVRAKDGDKAVAIYKDMLEKKALTNELRAEIRDRINFIGTGKAIADAAVNDLENWNLEAASERVRQFESQAKGLMKKYNESKVNTVKTIIECQKYKKEGNTEAIEKKKKDLGKKFYGIMAETEE